MLVALRLFCSVRPPKKSWKNISNLSGGEKTLASLALVFALHHFKVKMTRARPLRHYLCILHSSCLCHRFLVVVVVAYVCVKNKKEGRDGKEAKEEMGSVSDSVCCLLVAIPLYMLNAERYLRFDVVQRCAAHTALRHG